MSSIDTHLYDEIPRLLTGDADQATVQAAATHLPRCADCTEELISAVVAHASLSSAARYAPDVVTGNPPPSAPPEVEEETTADDDGGSLPDLSSMFAQIRQEARAGASETPRAPRVRRLNMKIAVAAAVVGVGLAGGAGYYAADQLNGPATRTVAISPFGVGHTTATATVVGDNEIKLNASSLPPAGNGQYYQVWLTDAGRTQLAPVGPLDAQRQGTYVIAPSLLDNYSAIEVSVQNAAGTGAYSGTSVLRGTYR